MTTLKIKMITTVCFLGCGLNSVYAATDPVAIADSGSLSLQHQSSFSRVSISLDDSFKPVVKERATGFEIHIPSATLMDLGIPFGGENAFNRYLTKIQD